MIGLLGPLLVATAVVAVLLAAHGFDRSGLVIRLGARGGRVRGSSRRTFLVGVGSTRAGRLLRPYTELLSGAGWRLEPEAFSGIRVLTAACGVGLCLPVPGPGLLLAPIGAIVGARLPVIAARRATSRRRLQVDAEIPQLLDLLAASSSAGLSAQLCLRRSVDAVDGPLADELAVSLRRVDLGARWRDELASLAERLGLADLRRAVAALTRTDTLGASLADSTAELATAVRGARRDAVTERARTAPVKMLFPLVFLVLPAFLLLTVVPVLLTTLQSIR